MSCVYKTLLIILLHLVNKMGIKRFQAYAETFFGANSFNDFTVQSACYRMKDFWNHEIDSTLRKQTHTANLYDKEYDRCGIYIDLASFMYGCVLRSLEHTEQYAKMMLQNETTTTTATVVCELSKATINNIVEECKGMLIETLGPMLFKAYRIYFAYDTFTPHAKLYEQTYRKKRSHFSLASSSRDACYRLIVTAIREFMLRMYVERLEKEGETEPQEVVKKVMELQFSSYTDPFCTNAPFTMGEGEWKCFYRIHHDFTIGAVDSCYVFGHDWDIALAMTLYQPSHIPHAIKYVFGPTEMFAHTKIFDEKERMLHFICLSLFGNDYIGGLVNLSDTNAALLKHEWDDMYTGDTGACTSEQVEYLSDTLFKHKTIPENQDTTENEERVDNADTRMRLSRAFATVVVRLLAAVYGVGFHPGAVDSVLHYADIGPYSSHPGPNRETLKLRKHLANQRRINEEDKENICTRRSGSGGTKDENTLLTCKDRNGHETKRTLQQCMDSFALCMLWYLSYALFYFRSPSGRQKMWMCREEEEIPMFIGLCMGPTGTYRYNDTRLTPRYDLCRLLELKNTLKNINSCNFYWIVEGAFDNALHVLNSQ